MVSRAGLRLAMSVLAIAFSLVGGAAYSEGAKKVINAQTITTYPPFSFKDPTSSKLTGFDIDTLNSIAAKMGAEVNWIETSFDQLVSFAALKTKRADMTGSGMGDIPQRRETVSFLDYVYELQMLYTLRANADQFKNPDALCGKRVAITRSAAVLSDLVANLSQENCAKAGKPAIVVMGSDNSGQSQQMLNQGRVDVAVSGGASLAYQNTLEGNRYVTLGKPLNKTAYGMSFLKDNQEFGQALKKAFTAIIADGTYDQLLRKWNMPDGSSIEHAMINGEP